MNHRLLLAAALLAPALAVVPAAPASAGCAEDYAAALSSGNEYLFPSPSPTAWVTASGLVITINGPLIVSDVSRLALFPAGVVLTEARYTAGAAPGATTAFVDCVV